MKLLRTAARGLTLRGRCLLAAGAALGICSVALGQDDLLRVAILLLVLPPVAVIVVLRTRYRLSCTRYLDPARVPAGETTEVHLALDNVSRLPSGVMLMEDALPYALGGRPRFVLDRIEPSGVREVSYAVRSDVRGRFRIGPLSVRLTDPFGLCELHRSFSGSDDLVVTPLVHPLPLMLLGGDRSGGGGEASVSALSSGTSDTTTREYRYGDDLRRVHWRSTARTGELMVRQEESPRQERATLLLDTRAHAHRGEGPGSSFEWAVSALASIGVSLSRQRFTINLATGLPLAAVLPGVPVDESVLLDALAEVQSSDDPTLERLVTQVRTDRYEGVLIAMLGSLTPTDADLLGRMTSSGSKIAFVLDAHSWTGGKARPSGANDSLRGAGWQVLEVRRGTLIAAAWSRVGVAAVDPFDIVGTTS